PTDASIVNFFRSERFLITPRNILSESIPPDSTKSCNHSHRNCKNLSPGFSVLPRNLLDENYNVSYKPLVMRIAQVAPLFLSVPPKFSGGTERVVSYLTEELVAQGHEVTLFASGDSETRAKLVSVCPQALWQVENYLEPEPLFK